MMWARRRRVRPIVAFGALAAAAVVASLLLPHAADAAPRPALLLSSASANPGETITVRGVNWPESTSVTISVCGKGTKARTADCDLERAVTTTGDEKGNLVATLVVAAPPTPCPCTVRAATPTIDAVAATPLLLGGAPFQALAAPKPAAGPQVAIEKVVLSGGSSVGALFGGNADRTLVLTLHNRSASTVASTPVFVDVGRSTSRDSERASVTLRGLEPNEQRIVRIPVTVDGPTFGRYVVSGRVGAVDAASPFTVRTSSYPWGLFVLAILSLQGVLLLGRNHARRRLAVEGASGSAVAAAPTPVPVAESRLVASTPPTISWRPPVVAAAALASPRPDATPVHSVEPEPDIVSSAEPDIVSSAEPDVLDPIAWSTPDESKDQKVQDPTDERAIDLVEAEALEAATDDVIEPPVSHPPEPEVREGDVIDLVASDDALVATSTLGEVAPVARTPGSPEPSRSVAQTVPRPVVPIARLVPRIDARAPEPEEPVPERVGLEPRAEPTKSTSSELDPSETQRRKPKTKAKKNKAKKKKKVKDRDKLAKTKPPSKKSGEHRPKSERKRPAQTRSTPS